MNLLFVLDHIFLTRGDTVYSNTFSYEFLERYVDLFSQVTVVARQRAIDRMPSVPVASGPGVRFVFLESIASPYAFFGRRQRHAKILGSLIAAHSALIVRLPSEFGLMAARAARRMQKAYLAETVGCAWDAMRHYGGWQARLYAPLLFWRMRRAVRHAGFVLYVTDYFLQRRYPPSPQAKTAAVSDVLLPENGPEVLSRRLEKIRMAGAKVVIGTIANLDLRYKGVDTAIKAAALLKAGGMDVEYRIVGEGAAEPHRVLAQGLGIESSLVFEGKKRHEDVFAWFDAIDLYVLPSMTEGLPRSLIEAMSRACPAVGTTVGGIPELLEPAVLTSPGNAEGLAATIVALAPDAAMMMHQARRNHAEAKRFEKNLLEGRRRAFLSAFRDACLRT